MLRGKKEKLKRKQNILDWTFLASKAGHLEGEELQVDREIGCRVLIRVHTLKMFIQG